MAWQLPVHAALAATMGAALRMCVTLNPTRYRGVEPMRGLLVSCCMSTHPLVWWAWADCGGLVVRSCIGGEVQASSMQPPAHGHRSTWVWGDVLAF